MFSFTHVHNHLLLRFICTLCFHWNWVGPSIAVIKGLISPSFLFYLPLVGGASAQQHEIRTPAHSAAFCRGLHPSPAAEQSLFHCGEAQSLGPHLQLDVLLSLFQWSLHQIDHSPKTFLQSHTGRGWTGLDEPGPALAYYPQVQFQAEIFWIKSTA